MSDAGATCLSDTISVLFEAIVRECRRLSCLFNILGSTEVQTAIRLLFANDISSRALHAACTALSHLVYKRSSAPLASSRSSQCGLVFPVGHIHHLLLRSLPAVRVDATAAICIAAVLDFICSEVLRHACDACLQNAASVAPSGSRATGRDTTILLCVPHVQKALDCNEPLLGLAKVMQESPLNSVRHFASEQVI